jgi:hypothetical protein
MYQSLFPGSVQLCVLCAFLLLSFSPPAWAQNRPQFEVPRITQPPRIDAELDDEAWREDPLDIGEWISYNPLRGEKFDKRTEVRIAYDDRNIYIAFHCFDSEPDKIRTTISRRDSVFNDDWVGLSLDSAGTGQTAYHLFVNPSGIQMDALQTSSSGERFEADMIWDSAGKITDDGYVVEIKLPLQTIRFSGGDQVKMGVLFFRRISRSGISASWPEMPPGQWVFNSHSRFLFNNLTQPRLIELLPSVTYGINQIRATPSLWNDAERKGDAGLSVKFGITSNITIDATINPDFSQVESDAFQVEVNQRFPIFFSEKRPFFMEGMGLFNIAGTNGDGNMRTAVHTRRIVDPSWGSKLTGTAGKVTFGLLNASDDSGDVDKLFTIGRATYSLGESNYIGGIFTDTEQSGRHNRVAGGDISYRFNSRQSFSATFLGSQTGEPGEFGAPQTSGTASQVSYNYETRRALFLSQVEHYGRGFVMDTAFFNRTGITSGWAFGEVNFYPGEGSWVKRIHPFVWTKQGRDQVQDGNEAFLLTGIRFNLTRQGFFNIDHGWGHEPFIGRQFKTHRMNTFGNIQLFRWLNVGGNFRKGYEIRYDPTDPFQGRVRSGGLNITLQPNQHVSQDIDYNGVRFNRASTGERVFTVHILNLKTTYQFNKHFLIRLLNQFDSSRHRLLTDLLASYEFVPGTVLHAGYGSLYEKRGFQDGQLVPDTGNYLTTSRGLFFKASYLHRF